MTVGEKLTYGVEDVAGVRGGIECKIFAALASVWACTYPRAAKNAINQVLGSVNASMNLSIGDH